MSQLWDSFDECFCLSLEGQIERQRSASAELCNVGLDKFSFFSGISHNSQFVIDSYKNGSVYSYPPCFRCGNKKCKCENNTLIPAQVACFASFMQIFRHASKSSSNTFLVAEDDIKFQPFDSKKLFKLLQHSSLHSLDFFSKNKPCLLQLGTSQPLSANEFTQHNFEWVKSDYCVSNYLFGFNKAFALFALSQFKGYMTTSDIFIHVELARMTNSYSLHPKIAFDKSWSAGTIQSNIHPKVNFAVNEANPIELRLLEEERLQKHIKSSLEVPVGIAGIPRGGTKWSSEAAQTLGFHIGHEQLQSDGISSWMLPAGPFDKAPFGKDKYSLQPYYLSYQKKILVVRPLKNGIGSQVLENSKNIQSLNFRQKLIAAEFNFNLNEVSCPISQAVMSATLWYLLLLRKGYKTFVKVGDIDALAGVLNEFKDTLTPDHQSIKNLREVNSLKPYLGQVYQKNNFCDSEIVSALKASPISLREYFRKAYLELPDSFADLLFEGFPCEHLPFLFG